MNCCPTSILDLGCFPCTQTSIPVPGATWPSSETLTLVTDFNGQMHTETLVVTSGEDMEIPVMNLNESYTYTVQLYKEDGATIDHNGNDAYRFTRKVSI